MGRRRKMGELAADDEAAAETSAEFKTDLNVAATTATDVAAGGTEATAGNQKEDAITTPQKRPEFTRKCIDFNAGIVAMVQQRLYCRNYRDRRAVQPSIDYARNVLPPSCYGAPQPRAFARYCHTSVNKNQTPVNVLTWTPEGRVSLQDRQVANLPSGTAVPLAGNSRDGSRLAHTLHDVEPQ